ncbi:MAG: hypothetical protein HOC70_10425 [Gammaproteobacteria bacterium]|jgi:hypothetical protein|nr:hypothetical protein [Gammaproteobacteria bacterium]MBT4493649.1 hypothetical protein [Gammaproteobacteria bacterium]
MTVIDMSTLNPIGEFGSRAWGEAVVKSAIEMLEAARLPASITWALTEDYTHPPARLMESGRRKAGYYLMVKEGEVSGGDGVIDHALTIPGFHCKMPWGVICNQAAALYGTEGLRLCTADEKVLYAAMAEYVGRPEINKELGLVIDKGGKLSSMLDPVGNWPAEVVAALGENMEEGNGLHNIAATLLTDSPEYTDLPVSTWRVPIFAEMTDQQKAEFVRLCGI